MAKIRVTKEFHFEMAHALKNYDGPCKNIHGHSYKLDVTLIGNPVNDPSDPKNGMVVDFSDIKQWIREKIVKKFDHSLLLYSETDTNELKNISDMFSRLEILDFQPTCENLLIYMAGIIKEQIPEHITLHSLKLRETESSYAEWFAEDNPDLQ